MMSDRARIPSAYTWATYDAPDLIRRVCPARAVEESKLRLGHPMVAITGPTGVGKSILAHAMAVARGESVAWIAEYHIRGNYLTPEDHAALISIAISSPVLVLDGLDNFGSRAPRPRHQDDVIDRTVETVVLTRLAAGLRTIVTTTYAPEVFAEAFGREARDAVFGGALIALDPNYDWKVWTAFE